MRSKWLLSIYLLAGTAALARAEFVGDPLKMGDQGLGVFAVDVSEGRAVAMKEAGEVALHGAAEEFFAGFAGREVRRV